MTSEVEERLRLITAGYGRHRSQWVKGKGKGKVKTYLFITHLDSLL